MTDEERRAVPALAGTSHAVFISGEAGRSPYRLRFFTGEGELPACGHGTVAALAVLAARDGGADYQAVLDGGGRRFEGWARRAREGGWTATFDPGAISLRQAREEEVRAVGAGLGLVGGALGDRACVASPGRPRLLLPVGSRGELADLRPDFGVLRQACDRYGLLGCYVYSIPDADGRAAARMFAPSIGVAEDVANANSTACLAAHLAGRGVGGIAVDMGDQLGRPSTVLARAGRDGFGGTVVRLGGVAGIRQVHRGFI